MPKQIAIIDLRGLTALCVLILWGELAKLYCVFMASLSLSLSLSLSDGILYIQRTKVKNLTKTMEIIIDFFFIWK